VEEENYIMEVKLWQKENVRNGSGVGCGGIKSD
jgi:hypothetical protein